MSTSLFSSLSALLGASDEQLMWRVQMHDDAGAFAQLVRRWEGPMRRLCTRMTGDQHKAEDLAQETFTRLYSHRKDYQASGKLSTFLWRIALNLCYDELRRIKRRGESSLSAEDGEGNSSLLDTVEGAEPSPATQLIEEERARWVRTALMQLPKTYRSVLILRHYEDLKFREIAEVLDIPEGTVKSRMAEAMSQLSRLLRPNLPGNKANLCRNQNKRIEESLIL